MKLRNAVGTEEEERVAGEVYARVREIKRREEARLASEGRQAKPNMWSDIMCDLSESTPDRKRATIGFTKSDGPSADRWAPQKNLNDRP